MFIDAQEETCKNGSADAMPGAADGTGQYGEGLGSEEGASKNGGKSCVLHAYLDADGALLGLVEASYPTCRIAKDIAQRVVTEHHSECPEEEHQATSRREQLK